MAMKVGLVLGAGGVMGGAWLTGGLAAVAEETGWDPGQADYIVGTSAGSMIGGLVSAGVPPWFMVAHSGGETFQGLVDADGRPAAQASRSAGSDFKLHRGLPGLGPGSVRLGVAALARPMRHTPAAAMAAWLPRGLFSTESLKDTIRRVVPSGWSDHPNTWIVACDYGTGRRVPFGREGSPKADLADAVAASCAIPGFFRPEPIGGHRYVDGGMWSPSNLDLVGGLGLDLVICLNPTSTLHQAGSLNPLDQVAGRVRRNAGRRLGREAKKVRAAGTEVVLIQPTARDLEVMGRNLMSGARRHECIELALETVAEQLREQDLPKLPKGEAHMIRRPDGPPSSWPQLRMNTGRAAGSEAA